MCELNKRPNACELIIYICFSSKTPISPIYLMILREISRLNDFNIFIILDTCDFHKFNILCLFCQHIRNLNGLSVTSDKISPSHLIIELKSFFSYLRRLFHTIDFQDCK